MSKIINNNISINKIRKKILFPKTQGKGKPAQDTVCLLIALLVAEH